MFNRLVKQYEYFSEVSKAGISIPKYAAKTSDSGAESQSVINLILKNLKS